MANPHESATGPSDFAIRFSWLRERGKIDKDLRILAKKTGVSDFFSGKKEALSLADDEIIEEIYTKYGRPASRSELAKAEFTENVISLQAAGSRQPITSAYEWSFWRNILEPEGFGRQFRSWGGFVGGVRVNLTLDGLLIVAGRETLATNVRERPDEIRVLLDYAYANPLPLVDLL